MNNPVGKKNMRDMLFENKVTLLFVLLCIGAFFASKQTMGFLLGELFTRIGRNTFLVLSLLIPVLAGMGLNFGIVIGAMAAQIAVFSVSVWGITGFKGFALCVLLSTPLSILFGYGAGKLFNKMKGSEMIGGMVLGYCANGLYQLLFLFIFGGVIPINNSRLMISGGVGVKNTIDLKDTIKYALDELPLLHVVELALVLMALSAVIAWSAARKKGDAAAGKRQVLRLVLSAVGFGLTFVPPIRSLLTTTRYTLLTAVEVVVAVVIAYTVGSVCYRKLLLHEEADLKKAGMRIALAAVAYALTYVDSIYRLLLSVKVPVVTYCMIGLLCFFNEALMKTRLGQNMRTVGQSLSVATASGINVDRTRIIAIIFSTVLAGYGQLISMQNIGTFQTYGAHETVGQFAIAALLVGGASVQKATNKQAVLGVVLFHTLFILAPSAGKNLFGNSMIGEYFRVFVAYGVIALSLAMHAWKGKAAQKIQLKPQGEKPGAGPSAEAEGAAQ